MKHSAEQDRFGFEILQIARIHPGDKESESVSRRWNIVMTTGVSHRWRTRLEKTGDYRTYIQRAQYYKNMFGCLPPVSCRAKMNDTWVFPLSIRLKSNFNYTEWPMHGSIVFMFRRIWMDSFRYMAEGKNLQTSWMLCSLQDQKLQAGINRIYPG